MAKRGARSKYEVCVKPHLDEIKKKVREGVTEAAIAQALNISVASLNNYRNRYPEFAEALSKDKGKECLQALINAGVKAAIGGYKLTTKKTIWGKDENGEPVIEKQEEYETEQPPNPALNKFYVMNFGKEQGFSNDPVQTELKRQKQEFEEKIEKAKNWHLKL